MWEWISKYISTSTAFTKLLNSVTTYCESIKMEIYRCNNFQILLKQLVDD